MTGAFSSDDKERLRRAKTVIEKPIDIGLLRQIVSGILHETAPRAWAFVGSR